jgi:hypothetical protein
MNSSDRIKQLQLEIEKERSNIKNCTHSFGTPYYDPETVKEPYGSLQIGRGSDPYWGPEGYRDVKKDRWTRKCITCGYEQHTNVLEPVIIEHKPKF